MQLEGEHRLFPYNIGLDIISFISIHLMHCIPAEDLLLQRKLKGSWDEDKAYLTLKKYVHTAQL
jgi:hypothetical protein